MKSVFTLVFLLIGLVTTSYGVDTTAPLASSTTPPHIVVQFCMKRNFMELRSFLEHRNSKLIGFIDGENYPPPVTSQYIASFTSLIFFCGIALLMAGDSIFAGMGIPEPEFYHYIKNNRMTTFGALFLLNNLGNSMLTTGAFEIFIDGKLEFSRLQTGRFPTGDELVAIMERYNIKLS